MFNYKTDLISHYMIAFAADLAAGTAAADAWSAAIETLASVRGDEHELRDALEAKDPALLQSILDGYESGDRRLPDHDRDLLKRAVRAFRKRLGSTRLDDESTVGGGPMSGGRASGIAGVSPPNIYPEEIWKELVRRGKLRSIGHGIYELPRGP